MFEAEQVAESCRGAAGTDVSFASDDELCQTAIVLEAARAALDAAQLHVLGELEVRGVCDRRFGVGTASWLAEHAKSARPDVASRVKLATKLRAGLGQVDEALSDGRITLDHARAIADAANPRIAETVIDHQGELIEAAQHAPFAIWRRMVAELAALWDQDGGYDPVADLTRNRLNLNAVGDSTAISGELVGEAALTVSEVIEREADKLWRRYQRDHEQAPELEIPSRATLRALALVEICRRSQGSEPGQAPAVDLTLIARLADGEVEPVPTCADPDAEAATDPAPICTEPDAEAATQPAPISSETPTTTTDRPCDPPAGSTSDLSPTDDGTSLEPSPLVARLIATLFTPDGQRLDPARYAHLLCDPVFHPMLVDGRHVPLALGRDVRLASRSQRRALAARDGGCVFPGCDRPPGWCDAHHIRSFEDGGSTDLINLILLCRHHHGVTHRIGWNLAVRPDGSAIWTTPAGLILPGQRRPQQLALAA